MKQIETNDVCPFGSKLQPYWDLRYELFSKFDNGIQIDEAGLYSVKPEASALRIANSMPFGTVIDAFGGVGGSAIAFARSGHDVISIELDSIRAGMARDNATIYGVQDRITFRHGDFLSLIDETGGNSIYFDPHWGGPSYATLKNFPLEGFAPNGHQLIEIAKAKKLFMAFTVPRNFDFNELRYLQQDFVVAADHLGGRLLYFTVFVDFREL
jgi:trimethylguanosine synthase